MHVINESIRISNFHACIKINAFLREHEKAVIKTQCRTHLMQNVTVAGQPIQSNGINISISLIRKTASKTSKSKARQIPRGRAALL